MPRRSPEEQKLLNNITTARRELVKAVERFAKVDDTIGLRTGHKAEALRRARAVRDAAAELLETLASEDTDDA